MEREWEPEQRDLGGLGLAGICRETSRVVLRVILGPPLLSALLLANAVVSCARGLDEGTSLLRLVAAATSPLLCVLLLLLCTAAYVLCVASLYRTSGDLRAADRVLKESEWDLGGLGLAGICRETSRVFRRAILPNVGPRLLSALLLADAALFCALPFRAPRGFDDGTSFLRLVADYFVVSFLDTVCALLFLLCTGAYVLCVASLHRTGGELGAADLLLDDLPIVPPAHASCLHVLLRRSPLHLTLPSPGRSQDHAASAAYFFAAVCQLACVVSVLEDAALFGAVRRSRELLAGKFWAAACVFVTLDGCIIAVLKAFTVLVVDDALGLGLWFHVAAGATMFVALRAVLVFTLVVQPVVYIVCKSHHQEVVDMTHLD